MADVVFDLDAVEAEAQGKPFPFKVGGKKFILPPAGEADWKALAAIDRQDFEAGFRRLLGAQWPEFEAQPLSTARMGKLISAYLASQGAQPGESPASTDS